MLALAGRFAFARMSASARGNKRRRPGFFLIFCLIACLTLPLMLSACGQSDEEKAVALRGDREKDYMPPELRKRVNALIADAEKTPTTSENMRERAALMWEWMNAFSMTGGPVTPDMPTYAAAVMAWAPGNLPPAIDAPGIIHDFILQLAALDAYPDGLGSFTAPNTGPFVAGSFQTITQIYTVGRFGLQPGGGFTFGRQRVGDYGMLQTTEPHADNYITATTSREGARLVPDQTSKLTSTIYGDPAGKKTRLFFRLEGEALEEGDTVTLTFGDTSGGGRGLSMQSNSSDRAPLPVFVAFDKTLNFFMLPLQPFVVTGGPAVALHGFAPSIVTVGEQFALSIRAEDRYRNRASGAVPQIQVFLNGSPFRTLPAGTQAITLLNNIRLQSPGIYRFSFASMDGALQGEANPILVSAMARPRIYWGELHGHTGMAEGQGSPEGYFRYGLDDARLDFIAHTEHDSYMDALEWEMLRRNAMRYNRDGEFVVFLSYEWTQLNDRGGHHNVFFRTPANRKLVPMHTAPTLSDLYFRLRKENDLNDVLIIPHAHESGDWRRSDPQLERLVEIASDHGTFEWFGRAYLGQGLQTGFIASGDNHDGHPGYSAFRVDHHRQTSGLAALRAENKNSQTLFDAMRARAAYGTTGARIILDFTLNGAPMGQRVAFAPIRDMAISVVGTAPISQIAIIRNGEEIFTQDYEAANPTQVIGETSAPSPASSSSAAKKDAPKEENTKKETGNASKPAGAAGTNNGADTGKDNASTIYELVFETPSAPPGIIPNLPRENPRAWQDWEGSVTVSGAILDSAEGPDFLNPRLHRLRIDAEDTQTVHFTTTTRGTRSALRLNLSGVTKEAMLSITLPPPGEQKLEDERRGQKVRALAPILFKLSEAGGEKAVWRDDKAKSEPVMRLRRVRNELPLEAQLTLSDADRYLPGDSYYVRVRQIDGHQAWSSPIWVGGLPPR
jgi:hypothetical protein